jgi:hypothetical protein
MRKSFILVGFILLFSTYSLGQVIIGAKGGLNVSTLGTSSLYQPRLGYHLGLFYSQHLEEQYGWQIGLQYSLQGARDASLVNGRLNYHYLSMPLVLKLYFSGPTFAEVGPQLGYLLGASYTETGFKDDRSDVVRKWDILGLVGFGFETDSGTTMGLRFGVGFLNTSGASVGNAVVYRNLLLQAHIGFKLKEIE